MISSIRRAGRRRLAGALAACLVAWLLPAGAARAVALDPEARSAAAAYLEALLSGDAAAARRLSPTKLENKHGRCPFAAMPRLEAPRVDMHRGAVMFKGRVRDPQLTPQGGITLTKLDGVKGNPWRVRQVAFFTDVPLGARIPPRSITRRDIAQEPLVVQAARQYLAAWLRGDYRAMHDLAFDWQANLHPQSQPIRVRAIEFTGAESENGEIKINFTADVTLYYVLPRTLSGTVYAMREDGRWKIRGNELTF